jgi:long-chain acyl-CoA synthetase
MKLVDVPEMNYLSTDRVHVLHSNEKIECRGRGEIYIRGPNVFRGYYQREDLTRQALEDKNTGWLKTGDIGVFLPNGALKIVDRRKNIFKLQQGEYVVPEKIESVYANSKFCDQVFVDGDSLHAHVVGVVVANPASIKRWASKRGIDCDDIASICSRKDLKRDILKELRRLESKYKLRYYERLHDIYVSFEPFSPENGLLTPTYKLKRNVARSQFSKQIANMQADVKIAGRKGLRQGRVVSCEPFSNSENKTPTHKKLKHNVKIMGRKVSRQGRVAVLGDLSNVRQN